MASYPDFLGAAQLYFIHKRVRVSSHSGPPIFHRSINFTGVPATLRSYYVRGSIESLNQYPVEGDSQSDKRNKLRDVQIEVALIVKNGSARKKQTFVSIHSWNIAYSIRFVKLNLIITKRTV